MVVLVWMVLLLLRMVELVRRSEIVEALQHFEPILPR
jgi:hypothetical protein